MSPIVEAKVTPSIGDNVLLYLNGTKPTQAPVISFSEKPLAATIAYVWGPAMVNLNVIDHNGNSHALTSVAFVEPQWIKSGAVRPETGMYCELACVVGELLESASGPLVSGMSQEEVDGLDASDLVDTAAERVPSFGERAVGLSFNPSQDPSVYQCKTQFAALIDQLDTRRHTSADPEVKRLCSVAITEAQGAQMWAVKALTWQR